MVGYNSNYLKIEFSDKISETLFDDLEGAIVKSKNPIFKNIIDHLVEEENAEEELLYIFNTLMLVGLALMHSV